MEDRKKGMPAEGRRRRFRLFVIPGSLAFLAGAVDPLEGSILILAGGLCILAGILAGGAGHPRIRYWMIVCFLVGAGTGAMMVLSSLGGLGGARGLSPWWGLLILPYPAGWITGVVGLVLLLIRKS